MDARKMMTKAEYQIERAAILKEISEVRSGRYGSRTAMYLYGYRTAAARIRSVYYSRKNAKNRK